MKKLLSIIGRIGILGFAGVIGAITGFLSVAVFVKVVMGTTPMLPDAVTGAWVGAACLVLLALIFPKPMAKMLELVTFFT